MFTPRPRQSVAVGEGISASGFHAVSGDEEEESAGRKGNVSRSLKMIKNSHKYITGGDRYRTVLR